MTTFLYDLRYATRVLLKHRAFALAAIGTITLAIAANTAIFSLIYGVLLKPLPLPEADRLMRIEERHGGRRVNLTGATFSDLAERARAFEAIAAYRLMSPGFSTPGAAPQQVLSAEVSPQYFAAIAVPPALGRSFEAADFGTPSARAVIVSDGVWRRLLGGSPAAIGRRVNVNAVPMEVVGIMPRALEAPGGPEIWLPRPSSSPLLRNRRAHLFTVIARLAPGRTPGAASEELAAVGTRIVSDTGGVDPGMSFAAMPLLARQVESSRPALLVLWAAVGVLFLIASANIANLLLMQGASRARELSIRAALGARRGRIVRQLATETLLLGAIGGLLGTVLGAWAVPALRAALPASLPRAATLTIDVPVLAFGIAISVVATLLFGVAPALRASARRPVDALRDRTGGVGAQGRLRGLLVAVEVALTVVLLAGAGLLARSFYSVLMVSPGFDASQVLTLSISPLAGRYPSAAEQGDFYARVIERLAAAPGVRAAAVTGALPLTGGPATTMVPDRTGSPDSLSADVVTVSPAFFSVLRIPVLRGRGFTEQDGRGAQAVMLINDAAARRFWPDGADPVGRTITMMDWGSPYPAQVVGIVGNVHQNGLETDVMPAVYYPIAQFPEATLSHTLVVRSDGDPAQLATVARDQVWAVDREQPIAAVRPLEDIMAAAVAARRFNLVLIGAFAASALVLASLGVYGIVAFAVGQRTREIGLRLALGARRLDIVRVAATQAFLPIGAGLLAGIAAALAAARSLRGLLFGVPATDPVTLVAVLGVVTTMAALAAVPPVRRALGVDPVVALRSE